MDDVSSDTSVESGCPENVVDSVEREVPFDDFEF